MKRKTNVEKNLNLIKKLAWSFSYSTGKDYEELYGEALMAYIDAEKKYDPTKSTISLNSFAWGIMRNRLIDYCTKKDEVIYEHQMPHECMIPEPAYNPTALFELIDSLSPTSKVIADMVLNNKDEFIGYSVKECRNKIREMLRQSGWSWSMVWDGIRNIKSDLKELT